MVAAVGRAIAGRDGRVLLLGVTPELARLGADLTAVDSSPTMIARVWPGDTPSHRAVLADWRALPDLGPLFTAAIADGALNALRFPDEVAAVLSAVTFRLAPAGRLAIRCYLAPDRAEAETPAAVLAAAGAGAIASIHAFKWRLAMALCAEAGEANLALDRLWRAVRHTFPDRRALAAASGWSAADIADLDDYRGSPVVYSFPTWAHLKAAIPPALARPHLKSVGGYPLAERCPVLLAERA